MSVTVQVYDLLHGRPAVELHARVEHEVSGRWEVVGTTLTDGSGVLTGAGPHRHRRAVRVVLDTRRYFAAQGVCSTTDDVTVNAGTVGPGVTRTVVLQIAPHGYAVWAGQTG